MTLTMREWVELLNLWRFEYWGRSLAMDEYRERRIKTARAYMGWQ